MALATLIAFDRQLKGAVLPNQKRRYFNDAELAVRDKEAYHKGVDAARAKVDQQIVEMRTEMLQLGDGIFRKLAEIEPALVAQLRDSLPSLALEIARRLLAGYEPPPEVISRLCEEALGELFPERENLELVLSPRDAELLAKLNPVWLTRYPGLRQCVDPSLAPGDCQVRSRFGLTDARLQAKLNAFAHGLTTPSA